MAEKSQYVVTSFSEKERSPGDILIEAESLQAARDHAKDVIKAYLKEVKLPEDPSLRIRVRPFLHEKDVLYRSFARLPGTKGKIGTVRILASSPMWHSA